MDKVNIPRPIAKNILLNKYDSVDLLPFVESKEMTNYQLNFANTCRQFPVGYDFIVNTINKMHSLTAKGMETKNAIKDVADDYYRLTVKKETITEYLEKADGRHIRQDIARQLQKELTFPFVKLFKPNGHFVKRFPFTFEKADSETGEMGILLFKGLFEPFVTGEYNKKESDGFITVPKNFYAKLSLTPEDRAIKLNEGETLTLNNNALYRMNVLALLNDNKKNKYTTIRTQHFLENVIPELTKKDKTTKKLKSNYSEWTIHKLIENSLCKANNRNFCKEDEEIRKVKKLFPKDHDVIVWFET